METNDSNSESETTQGGETQNGNNQQSTQSGKNQEASEPKLTTNFLEFGEPNKSGEHTLALVYPPGEERGNVAARIYISYEGHPKHATFIAKDTEGNVIGQPTSKLWELKKSIKQQAGPLLEQSRLAKTTPSVGKAQPEKEKSIAEKEFKAMGTKVADEAIELGKSASEVIMPASRSKELKRISQKKVQKSRTLSR